MKMGRLGAGFSGLLAVAAFIAVESPLPSADPTVVQRASAEDIDHAVSLAHAEADAVSGKRSFR
jgi:hypothetical protein